MSQWRFVGECPNLKVPIEDGETISLDGLNPWRFAWTWLQTKIVVPDPRQTSRRFHMRVYELRGAGVDLIFAAGMVSNDSWGFYVPASADATGAFEAGEPKYEGHWRTSIDEVSELPWPTPERMWTGRPSFLSVLEKTEADAERIAYRGFSFCRVCGCKNGYEGLRLEDWEWPDGYKHYVVDHEVRPSTSFEAFILGRGKL